MLIFENRIWINTAHTNKISYAISIHIIEILRAIINTIQSFSFASDGNATFVGNQTVARYGGTGTSSSTYGYNCGGNTDGPTINVIDRFSFTSDGNGTDWADLSAVNYSSGGSQSTTHGYSLGGGTDSTRMDKFPYASATNATDIANLAVGGKAKASAQY